MTVNMTEKPLHSVHTCGTIL